MLTSLSEIFGCFRQLRKPEAARPLGTYTSRHVPRQMFGHNCNRTRMQWKKTASKLLYTVVYTAMYCTYEYEYILVSYITHYIYIYIYIYHHTIYNLLDFLKISQNFLKFSKIILKLIKSSSKFTNILQNLLRSFAYITIFLTKLITFFSKVLQIF